MNRFRAVPTVFFALASVALACNLVRTVPPASSIPTAVRARPAPTATTPQAAPATGSIEGVLHYPSEGIPAMTVYARNIETGETFSLTTNQNQSTFKFENLPAGAYQVFAWVTFENGNSIGGAYSAAVPCGLSVDCTDHSLITVAVAPNQTATGVDIADWYDQASVPQP